MWQTLNDTEVYTSKNWLSQVNRYPFTLDPYKVPGAQPALNILPDLQERMNLIKASISAIVGICTCRVSNGLKINYPPNTDSKLLSVSTGMQAVIDLQTGHLYITRSTLDLIKPDRTDWQYFLQYTINA